MKDPVEQDRFSKLSFGFGWVLPVDCGILFVCPVMLNIGQESTLVTYST